MSTRPLPDAIRDYRFPRVDRLVTSNGIRVIVAPLSRLPVATVLCSVDAGAIREDVRAAGVAQMTARGLAEGTTKRTGDALAESFEALGSAIEPDAGWDALELRHTVRSSRLRDLLMLASEVLTSPAFPETELGRLRDERLAEIMQRDTDPRGLADDLFARKLYGPESRVRFPIGGEAETVKGLSEFAVQSWYKGMVHPQRTCVVIAGSVEPNEALAMVEHAFGSWTSNAATGSTDPVTTRDNPAATHLVTRTESVQSEIRVGHAGPPRTHPDYFALTVLNAILGGLFGSRLNLNLREAHGYTYGAFSTFQWRRDGSTFVISTAVRSDATLQALREVMTEVTRIRAEEVSRSELTLAIEHLQGVFPIRFETTDALAVALGAQHVFGLPTDYFDVYRDLIGKVTAADVLRAAREHIRPEALQVTVIGGPALEEHLVKLEHGEMTVIDAATAVHG